MINDAYRLECDSVKPQTLTPDSLILKGLAYKNTGLTLIWHSVRRICTVCIPHVANSTVGTGAISSSLWILGCHKIP